MLRRRNSLHYPQSGQKGLRVRKKPNDADSSFSILGKEKPRREEGKTSLGEVGSLLD